MNGDGKADLISGSYVPGDIYWFKAGPNGFDAGQPISETKPEDVERAASAASFADFDGDGDLDMLVGNIEGDVFWNENIGTHTEFQFGPRRPVLVGKKKLTVPDGDAHPVAVDWDGDGILDLLLGCGDGSVRFCKGTKNGSSKTPMFLVCGRLAAGGKPISLGGRVKIFVTDWNGDGQLDLLAGNFTHKNDQIVGNIYLMLRNAR